MSEKVRLSRRTFLCHENLLHQQHIQHGAGSDRKEHIAFPKMQRQHHRTGDKFRQAVKTDQYVNILIAIHHQHTKHGGR